VCLLVIYLGEVEKFGKTKFGFEDKSRVNGRKKAMEHEISKRSASRLLAEKEVRSCFQR